jgi:hypothetical protein
MSILNRNNLTLIITIYCLSVIVISIYSYNSGYIVGTDIAKSEIGVNNGTKN